MHLTLAGIQRGVPLRDGRPLFLLVHTYRAHAPYRVSRKTFEDRGEDLEDLKDDLERCHVTVSVRDRGAGGLEPFEVTGDMSGSLLRLGPMRDGMFEARGFELDQPMSIRIYTLAEQYERDDIAADYGWIVEADSREIVWHPDDGRWRWGGGGKKNRLVNDQLELEPGRAVRAEVNVAGNRPAPTPMGPGLRERSSRRSRDDTVSGAVARRMTWTNHDSRNV